MANQPTKYRKFVVGAASAALVASAVAPVAFAADFSDTKGNTHEEAINALSEAGVIKGYEDGTFKPNKTLTRSDVVKLMGKWLVSEGYKVPTDAQSKPRFADLKSTSNKELLEMAAVVYDNGVFVGTPDGKLDPTGDITRENMAIVIVRAFDRVHDIDLASYVADQDFKKDVTDLGKAKAEARPAIDVLDFFDITNPAAPEFNPKATTTRGHFATFLHKTINADFSDVEGGVVAPGVASVKAVNATTVEVAMKEKIENINSLDFKIDGLTVSNAAIKQTDDKVVVLTTAVQKGGEKYTVTLNDKAIGSFTGVSSVIPTSIKMTQQSVQGKIGQQVILSADVGVKEAGIPVTFNVDATGTTLNKDQIFEAVTNADGIATFSYTQYNAGNDAVAAYPTGAPTTRDVARVFWGVDTILEVVADDKVGSELENTAVKQYKVVLKNAETGKPVSNGTVDLTFKENINVNVDELNNATINGEEVYQLNNGDKKTVEVTTNKDGEAVFYVSGENTSATPVAFLDTNTDDKLDATELNVAAEKVTFAATGYKFEITSKTGKEAANGSSNGREFEVVVKDKDGKPVQGRTVNVALDENIDSLLSTNTQAQVKAKNVNAANKIQVELDKDGKAKFTVISDKVNDYATPVVWIDVNNAGELDKGEPSIKGEKTYFAAEKVVQNGGELKVVDANDNDKDSFSADKPAFFKFTALNQSAKPTAATVNVSYTVKNTGASAVNVYDDVSGAVLKTIASGDSARVELTGKTTTAKLRVQPTATDKNASVQVTAVGTDVSGTPSINLGSKTATASFTSTTTVADTFTGDIVSIDTVEKEVKFANKDAVSYKGASFKNAAGNVIDEDEFETYVLANGPKATYTKDSAGKVSFEIISAGAGTVPDLSTPVTDNSVNTGALNLSQITNVVSSDTGVVTAAANGSNVVLTAKSEGTAIVTVTDDKGTPATADDEVATISVTVNEDPATGLLSIVPTVNAYDGTAPAAGTISGANGTGTAAQIDAGDKITITFNEPVKVSQLDIADFSVSGTGTTLGTTATVAQANTGAYDTTFVITLGTGTDVAANDTLSVAIGQVIDAAGNANTAAIDFTIPAASSF